MALCYDRSGWRQVEAPLPPTTDANEEAEILSWLEGVDYDRRSSMILGIRKSGLGFSVAVHNAKSPTTVHQFVTLVNVGNKMTRYLSATWRLCWSC